LFRHGKAVQQGGRKPSASASYGRALLLLLVNGQVRVRDRIGLELREESVMSRAVEKIIKERWPGTNDAGPWRGWSVEIVDTDGGIVRTVALDELG
jgi:hypothetical protein